MPENFNLPRPDLSVENRLIEEFQRNSKEDFYERLEEAAKNCNIPKNIKSSNVPNKTYKKSYQSQTKKAINMENQEDKYQTRCAKTVAVLLIIVIALLISANKCSAQSYRTVKPTVQYDTIPVINKDVISIYMMDKRNYMIYKYQGCQEAIQVSKSIVDYMVLCCELKCSCNLAILKRKKDGVLSRVIKYKGTSYGGSKNDYLNFKIYQK